MSASDRQKNENHFKALEIVQRSGIREGAPGWTTAYRRALLQVNAQQQPPHVDVGAEAMRRCNAADVFHGDANFAACYEMELTAVRRARAARPVTSTATKPVQRTVVAPQPKGEIRPFVAANKPAAAPRKPFVVAKQQPEHRTLPAEARLINGVWRRWDTDHGAGFWECAFDVPSGNFDVKKCDNCKWVHRVRRDDGGGDFGGRAA